METKNSVNESNTPSPVKKLRTDGTSETDNKKSETSEDAGDAAYHQGASFGLNFVTFAEYSGLRSEHDKLQNHLEKLKKYVEENVNQSIKAEISAVREENKRLRGEVNALKEALRNSGVVVKASNEDEEDARTDTDRLTLLESQMVTVNSRLDQLPPAPSNETVRYLENLVNFYSQTSAPNTPDNKRVLEASAHMPMKSTVSDDSNQSPIKSVSSFLPLPPHVTGISNMAEGTGAPVLPENGLANPLPDEVTNWQPPSDVQLTPSQPVPEESPYSLKVQLLPGYNIWVNRSKLTTLLQDSMAQTDNAPLFLLRKLIPMVFSWQELAFSRGQGITTKSREAGKAPLDAVKINACKDFMRLFCSQNNMVEPPDTAINTQFTHTITYARTKMKRNLGKPNCKVSTLMADDNINGSPVKEGNLDFCENSNVDSSQLDHGEAPHLVKSQYFDQAME